MDNYQVIRGLTFPTPRFFSRQNIEDTLDYAPRDGDIVVASYPKTGSTWLQYIVLQIVSKGECFPSTEELDRIFPFMESTGVRAVDELVGKRMYTHHYPYNMVKKNPKAKYIYIYRNPEDVFVSYFHFFEECRGKSLDFEQYFEYFLSGNILYGRCFEHILSYWEHRDDEGMLLVSYEQLLVNNEEEILKIAKFLGRDYYQNCLDESVFKKIQRHTSFEYMKKHLFFIRPKHCTNESIVLNFFRKGVIGDGKQSLSENQLKRLQNVMKDILKGTTLLEQWTKPRTL